MSGGMQGVTRHAEARAQMHRTRIVAEVGADFPGLVARIEGDDVVIEGRHLLDRWLRDARLRNVAREPLP